VFRVKNDMRRPVSIALAASLGLLIACAAEKPLQSECGPILRARCASCHDVGWSCRKLGARSRDRWRATIDRMVKHGAELTVAEKTTLLDCLDQRQEEVTAVCAGAAGEAAAAGKD
jgi:hypothetical protein